MKVKIVAALAAVALISGCGSSPHTSNKGASLPDGVAFKFGSRSVTVEQLNARDKALTALYGIQKPAGGSALDEFNRQAAKRSEEHTSELQSRL